MLSVVALSEPVGESDEFLAAEEDLAGLPLVNPEPSLAVTAGVTLRVVAAMTFLVEDRLVPPDGGRALARASGGKSGVFRRG
ncbi:MAG: hypothetical protein GWO24_32790 [Akkermansiaceae bacterium]|nr:hypothetical protein [Akkermansiaceae bacterium]